jgi:NADH-quinone oxidoreductase subunit E
MSERIQQEVDECIRERGDSLISVLLGIQERHNYLPEDLLVAVSERMGVSLMDVYGVATFYRAFSLEPRGRHTVTVCTGTACHVRGAGRMVGTVSRELGIRPGETTDDLAFTLETVNCLGCCAIGPIAVVDGEYYGQMNSQKTVSLIHKIRKADRKESGEDGGSTNSGEEQAAKTS